MYSTKVIKTISLVSAFVLAAATARAVDPPPDGGYPFENTAEGDFALLSLTTGTWNTALGYNTLQANTTGNYNTAVGAESMIGTTTGSANTAVGFEALLSNSAGQSNTAIGFSSMYYNDYGGSNTAVGSYALAGTDNAVTASDNTAIGVFALENITEGNQNTAAGAFALLFNYGGSNNTATGFEALRGSGASNNTADGAGALYSDTSGFNNTASGVDALRGNTTGNYNAAHGQGALSANTTGSNNTAAGQNALVKNTTGTSNIAIGSNAGFNLTTGSSNIDIGNRGVAGESKTIRVGIQGTQTAAFMAGISGATVPAGVGVIIGTNGHLGTVVSSARYKDAIKPMAEASEAILALKPVTFHYKKELDPEGIPQFGLVAEEVEKIDPDLVARDNQGKPYTVRYEAVNAMLLNEFLKAHHKVERQDATIGELKALVAKQQEQIATLASQMQRVSNRFEQREGAPRIVANEP